GSHRGAPPTVCGGGGGVGARRGGNTRATLYAAIRTFKAVTTIVSAAVEEQYG
ncbi:peptide ABC transporter substrate-binding protein, partial [Streptomyces fradiae]